MQATNNQIKHLHLNIGSEYEEFQASTKNGYETMEGVKITCDEFTFFATLFIISEDDQDALWGITEATTGISIGLTPKMPKQDIQSLKALGPLASVVIATFFSNYNFNHDLIKKDIQANLDRQKGKSHLH